MNEQMDGQGKPRHGGMYGSTCMTNHGPPLPSPPPHGPSSVSWIPNPRPNPRAGQGKGKRPTSFSFSTGTWISYASQPRAGCVPQSTSVMRMCVACCPLFLGHQGPSTPGPGVDWVAESRAADWGPKTGRKSWKMSPRRGQR
jgi:hypothetical protein